LPGIDDATVPRLPLSQRHKPKLEAKGKQEDDMKLKTMGNFVALSLTAVLTIANANAQSATMSADIPFAYSVAGKILPAGKYSVDINSNGVILVRSYEHAASAMLFGGRVQSRKVQTEASLVFTKYGDKYFLKQIWALPGNNAGIEVPPSRAEREQIAQVGQQVKLTAHR
jgi:hypothetical protein